MKQTSKHGWKQLAIWTAALAVIWLIVLPRLATVPPIREHIAEMNRKNIAVDAMFYTELDWQPPDGVAWRK